MAAPPPPSASGWQFQSPEALALLGQEQLIEMVSTLQANLSDAEQKLSDQERRILELEAVATGKPKKLPRAPKPERGPKKPRRGKIGEEDETGTETGSTAASARLTAASLPSAEASSSTTNGGGVGGVNDDGDSEDGYGEIKLPKEETMSQASSGRLAVQRYQAMLLANAGAASVHSSSDRRSLATTKKSLRRAEKIAAKATRGGGKNAATQGEAALAAATVTSILDQDAPPLLDMTPPRPANGAVVVKNQKRKFNMLTCARFFKDNPTIWAGEDCIAHSSFPTTPLAALAVGTAGPMALKAAAASTTTTGGAKRGGNISAQPPQSIGTGHHILPLEGLLMTLFVGAFSPPDVLLTLSLGRLMSVVHQRSFYYMTFELLVPRPPNSATIQADPDGAAVLAKNWRAAVEHVAHVRRNTEHATPFVGGSGNGGASAGFGPFPVEVGDSPRLKAEKLKKREKAKEWHWDVALEIHRNRLLSQGGTDVSSAGMNAYCLGYLGATRFIVNKGFKSQLVDGLIGAIHNDDLAAVRYLVESRTYEYDELQSILHKKSSLLRGTKGITPWQATVAGFQVRIAKYFINRLGRSCTASGGSAAASGDLFKHQIDSDLVTQRHPLEVVLRSYHEHEHDPEPRLEMLQLLAEGGALKTPGDWVTTERSFSILNTAISHLDCGLITQFMNPFLLCGLGSAVEFTPVANWWWAKKPGVPANYNQYGFHDFHILREIVTAHRVPNAEAKQFLRVCLDPLEAGGLGLNINGRCVMDDGSLGPAPKRRGEDADDLTTEEGGGIYKAVNLADIAQVVDGGTILHWITRASSSYEGYSYSYLPSDRQAMWWAVLVEEFGADTQVVNASGLVPSLHQNF